MGLFFLLRELFTPIHTQTLLHRQTGLLVHNFIYFLYILLTSIVLITQKARLRRAFVIIFICNIYEFALGISFFVVRLFIPLCQHYQTVAFINFMDFMDF